MRNEIKSPDPVLERVARDHARAYLIKLRQWIGYPYPKRWEDALVESFLSTLKQSTKELQEANDNLFRIKQKAVVENVELKQLLKVPISELEGTFPVILYFENDADREEFIAAVMLEKPNLKAKSL